MRSFKWDAPLELERLFGGDLPAVEMTGFDLAADVIETEKGVRVEMQLPGIRPDAYEIKVKDGVLIVTGKREEETEVTDKGYYRKEIQRGSFERHVQLPDRAFATATLSPTVKDGVLKVFIPAA